MKIKEKPEDFVVKEKLNLPLGEGNYSYFLLKKKQWNTTDAINEISKRLHINKKRINYAGLKDKQAITEQYISILNGKKEYENINIKDIKIVYLGNGAERIHIGQLEGNEFEIIVKESGEAKPMSSMPNYFDEQRFGMHNTNASIGKSLVQKDFKKACKILNIEIKDNNYVGALQKQRKMLSLYLHSYQSRIFNIALSEHIKSRYEYKELSCGYEQLAFPIEQTKEKIKIPLPSFDMEIKEGIIKKLLNKDGITPKDFIIKQLPELISQTEYREGFVNIKNLQIEKLKGNTKKVKFELPKGSYATTAIKLIFLQNL